MLRTISFTLNGVVTHVTTDDDRMLLWVLRNDLGLTGTKFGCGEGICGACTVILNNQAVRSCSVALKEVAGKDVLTIEGLGKNKLHPIQAAFAKHDAFQCGYCTPGMIMSAYGLLLQTPRPTRDEIVRHMDDNLCRCGSHVRVIAAIEEVSGAQGVKSGPSQNKGGAR